MKMTSEFMDKRIEELSRSHSDDLSELSYSHLREDDDDDDHFFGLNMLASNSSIRFEPTRPVVSEPSRASAFWNYSSVDRNDHVNSGRETAGTFSNETLISKIDCKMEEHTEKLLNVVEGLSKRLCRLDSKTQQIEQSVDSLKVSTEFNHVRTDRKLRDLENTVKEVQGGIQDLRDKQEISEARLELAKLQMLKGQQQSKKQKSSVDASSIQGVLPSVPNQSHQPDPTPVVSVERLPLPLPNVPPILSHTNTTVTQAVKLPSHLHQDQNHSVLNHQYTTQQMWPQPAALYQPYQPSQLPFSQLQHPPRRAFDQPSYNPLVQNPEENSHMPYQSHSQGTQRTPIAFAPDMKPSSQRMYLGSIPKIHDQPLSNHRSEFPLKSMQSYGNSDSHDYSHTGYPSKYSTQEMRHSQLPSSSIVKDSGTNFSQLPKAQILPHALPMASDVDSESGSSETGNSQRVDDVIENVVAMGFRRDIVRAMVRKMTENGQSVGVNVVLDKLMNNA